MNNKLTLSLVLTFIVGWASAQIIHRNPFWVVEGNINTPYYTILRFYSAEGTLIKEERIEGFFLNINKKKNVTFMNRKLARAVRVQEKWATVKKEAVVQSD